MLYLICHFGYVAVSSGCMMRIIELGIGDPWYQPYGCLNPANVFPFDSLFYTFYHHQSICEFSIFETMLDSILWVCRLQEENFSGV